MSKKINLKGQRFGQLTVIKDTGKRGFGFVVWLCRCDCGNLTKVYSNSLRTKNTRSCGCYMRKKQRRFGNLNPAYKHGDARRGKINRLYITLMSIIRRCENPNNKSYKYYGKRGIKICNEWRNDYLVFKKWALANGYADNITIDRIDSNGDYCPENCQWITNVENARKARIEGLN